MKNNNHKTKGDIMKNNNHKYIVSILAMCVFSLMFVAQSFAGDQLRNRWAKVNLVRSTLKNVDDAAGRFQHAGGKVYTNAGEHLGYYAATRRVTWGGTDAQNTAMFTMTIFILGEKPPQNITLQGSHDFNSGEYIGSVSAASSRYSELIGSVFIGDTSDGTLRIKK